MVDELEREQAEEVGWAARIAERRQYIKDAARCKQCGASQKECETEYRKVNPNGAGPEGLCCWGGIGHHHIESVAMVDQLLKEIMAGEVRTVAEAYPPPMQGPRRVSMAWLLEQQEWWYPQGRPAVRIAEMDKPHRWNLARWLERKAGDLNAADQCRGIWASAPDDVFNAVLSRSPMEFLAEQPLYRVLIRGLPKPGTKKGEALATRAKHWNSCPHRKAVVDQQAEPCVCIEVSGRTVGATNDPASLPSALGHVRPDTSA